MLRGIFRAPEGGVVLGQFFMEVRSVAARAEGPCDRPLGVGRRLCRTSERAEGDCDRVARDLDGVLVGPVLFPDCEGPLECRERLVVLAAFVEGPAEVVQERSAPVGRRLLPLAELDPARSSRSRKPTSSGAASAAMCAASAAR